MTKIMLVEDDKGLREIYGVRLLAEGYDIISAGDGEEALAMAIKDRPDLIVSDVMMPKISGFDMLDILRSTTETKDIKVIMMTALSSDEQRKRGEQLGADMYLVKSQVGIEDVVKAVHQVLADKPGAAPAAPAPATPAPQAPAAPASPITTGAAAAAGPLSAPTPPPAPAPDQTVSTVAPATSIPEPTAPFTGQRPSTLGDRVIQPLKDNPRVSNVDVGELIDKEFTSSIQDIENVPDGASSAVPPMETADSVSMPSPTPPAPAPDDGIIPPVTPPVAAAPAPSPEPAPAPAAPEPASAAAPVPPPEGHTDTPIVPPAR
ncbi:response regulator [Candidatus Saccharibacteria bacterium]|nr:response regulator [Candidatus Saccharibacteria bacterium]